MIEAKPEKKEESLESDSDVQMSDENDLQDESEDD